MAGSKRTFSTVVILAITAFGLCSAAAPAALAATTLTVNTTADVSPPCASSAFSLRCAISRANSDGSGDTITFNIPSTAPGCSGTPRVCIIKVSSALPRLTANSTTINGYSQPGAKANTNSLSAGDNAVITIRLDGGGAPQEVDGIDIVGSMDTVKGLSITNFKEKFLPSGLIQGGVGVNIVGKTSSGDVIQGDFLGVAPDGKTAGPNQLNGAAVSNGPGSDTIGGTTPAAANVVSGNGLCSLGDCTGVAINIGSGIGTLIAGNYVGTTASGAARLKNLATGVVILTPGNTLGKTGAGNVISANGADGVLVGASSTVISANLIGTNAAGTAGLGNVSHGIDDQGSSITITGNVISANGDTGLVLFGNDIVQGNFIGTSADGTAALGNGLNPSVIFNGQPLNGTDGITTCGGSNTIGGTAPGTGNVISANGGNGISLVSNSNVVQGNTIGTNGAGTTALPNLVDGIGFGGEFTQGTGFCQQAPDVGGSSNTIGGTASGAGNTISGNTAFGIKIIEGTSNLVQGNRIGTTASGTAPLGNGSDGVALQTFCDDGVCHPSSSNTIGGTTSGAGNIISGNAGNGISVDGTGGGTSNTVQGNHIGTDAGGTIALGNTKNGVILDNGAVNDLVGGTSGGAPNTIANNGQAGVQIGSSASDTGTHSPVHQNSIFNNLGLGIDLAPLGTVNCTTSPPGPNDYTACPVITSATTSQIKGTACGGCTVEVYVATGEADDQSHGEGKTLLGSVTAATGGSWSLTLAPGQVASGQPVTATATTPGSFGVSAETSEFAANVVVG